MEKIYFSPQRLYCILAITFTFLISTNSYGQVIPEGINYQAVARDTAGKPMAEVTDLAVRFSIFPDASSNDTIFSEVHSPVSTNLYGLFTKVIGSIDSVRFKNILWESGDKYLEVKIAKIGQDYSAMGRMRLVSVPYALYSKSSGDSWRLYGNNADTAMFLGTINNTDLKIKTDSITRIRVGGNGNVIILTNVGIGVGNPNSKLAIQTATGNELEFVSAISDTADITTVGTLKLGTSSTSPVYFKTNDTSHVVIDSVGNVGIGNLSPVSRLDVAGKVKITDGTEGLGKVLSSDGAGLASWVIPDSGTVLSFSADSLLPLFTTSVSDDTINPHLSFTLENAGAYTVFGNNTNAPGQPTYFSPQLNTALFQNQGTATTLLHGNAAGNPSWSQIVNADIANGTIDLTSKVTGVLPMLNGGSGAALSPVNGGIVYTNASSMQVSPAGATGQILTSNGAGVPSWTNPTSAITLNPLSPITVNASSPSVYDIGVALNTATSPGVVAAGTTNYNRVWKTDGTGTPGWRVDSSGVYVAGTGLTFSGDTINSVWTASGNNIYNNNSDNVGIGTTTPSAKLDVQNNSSTGSAGYFESTDSTNASPTLVAINKGDNGSALFVSETGLADAVVVSVTNTSNSKDALQINTNGKDAKGLSVNNTGISSTENYGAHIKATGAGNVNVAGYFNAENATENYAGIFENGNVGIGETQPLAKLEIYTDGSNGADEALYAETSGAGPAGTFVVSNPANNGDAVSVTTDGNDSRGLTVSNTGLGTIVYGTHVSSTGSGTTNVGGYFTSTGAINNYAAIFDNGNVGVGANAPAEKLVVGNGNISIFNNNNIAGKLFFGDPSGGGAYYTSFQAKSQTADIAYTLPAAQGATNTVLRNDGAGNLSWLSVASLGGWILTGNSGTNPTNNFIGTTDAVDFVIRTSNTERIRVKSGGNVGIGTTAPAELLHIVGGKILVGATTSSRIAIDPAATSINQLETATNLNVRGGSASGHLFLGAGTTGNIYFETGLGVRRMFIGTNGNIGIGTETPAEKLDILNGNLFLSNSNNTAPKLIFSEPSTSGTNTTSFEAQAQGANITYVLPATQGAANQVLSNNGSGTLSWTTVSGPTGTGTTNYVTKWSSSTGLTTSIIFDNGTNVGVGTTSPYSKFHVQTTSTTGIVQGITLSNPQAAAAGNGEQMVFSGINPASDSHAAVGTILPGASHNDAHMFFSTRTSGVLSEKMRITNAGNVGIGTTTPTSKLNVEGVGSATELFRVSNDKNATKDSVMVFTSAGNVGIGTTTPAEKLTINYVGGLADPLKISNSTGSTTTFHLTSDQRMLFSPSTSSTATLVEIGTGTGNIVSAGVNFMKINSGTVVSGSNVLSIQEAGTSYMTVTGDGNVGVGTATPTSKLDIVGGVLTMDNGDFAGTRGLRFRNTTDGTGASTGGGIAQANNDVLYISAGSANNITFRQSGGVTDAISFSSLSSNPQVATTGTNRLDINANSATVSIGGNTGNIGIGTTTPASKLDVEGGVSIGTTYSGSMAAPTNGAIIEGSLGIGTDTPVNKLDVEGGVSIGANYSGTATAPTNGVIIEGNVGIGTTSPSTNSRLAIRDGHLQSLQTTSPTVGAVINYVSGSQSISNATDMAGRLSILPIADAGSVTFNFNKVYAVAPIVSVTATNNSAASDITKMWVTSTVSNFTIHYSNVGGVFPPVANVHTYNYLIVETQN